jgi:hypothetical protein
MVTTTAFRISIIAASLATIVLLSGCAETISCACGPTLPEFSNPARSETKVATPVDSKENQIAGVSVEERNSQ